MVRATQAEREEALLDRGTFLRGDWSLYHLGDEAQEVCSRRYAVRGQFRLVALRRRVILSALATGRRVQIMVQQECRAGGLSYLQLGDGGASSLVFRWPFARRLRIGVRARYRILSKCKEAIVFSIRVVPLGASIHVAGRGFGTFLSARVLLVQFLCARLASVVTAGMMTFFVNFRFFYQSFSGVARNIHNDVVEMLTGHAPLSVRTARFGRLLLGSTAFFHQGLQRGRLVDMSKVSQVPTAIFRITRSFRRLDADGVRQLTRIRYVRILCFFQSGHCVVDELIGGRRLAYAIVSDSTQEVLGFVRRHVTVNILLVVVNDGLRCGGASRVGRRGERYGSPSGGFPFLRSVVFYRHCLLVPSATAVRIAIEAMRGTAHDDGDRVPRGRGGSVRDGTELYVGALTMMCFEGKIVPVLLGRNAELS